MNWNAEKEPPGSSAWFMARCDAGICQHLRDTNNVPHMVYPHVPVEVLAGCVNKDCRAGFFNCLDDDLKRSETVCERSGFPVRCASAPPPGTRHCDLCNKTGKI